MPHIERINRELKYTGSVLSMYADTIRVDGERTAVWDYLDHQGAAAVVPVTADGKIIMVKQYRNSLDRYTLEIPAGSLNGKEEPTIVAAARELEEETGYQAKHLEPLISVVTAIAFCNEVIDIYVATDLKKTQQHLDDDEFIDVLEFTPEELAEKIYRGEIMDSKTVAAIMSYINRK